VESPAGKIGTRTSSAPSRTCTCTSASVGPTTPPPTAPAPVTPTAPQTVHERALGLARSILGPMGGIGDLPFFRVVSTGCSAGYNVGCHCCEEGKVGFWDKLRNTILGRDK